MITFKQFLEESKSAPLYHGTHRSAALSIIENNKILRGSSYGEHWTTIDGKHISLTRDKFFALTWGAVVFELDQSKLNQNYKVIPFNFFSDRTRRLPSNDKYESPKRNFNFSNQFEEAVTKDINNALRYVTKIYINGNKLQGSQLTKFLDEINSTLAAQKVKIPVEVI